MDNGFLVILIIYLALMVVFAILDTVFPLLIKNADIKKKKKLALLWKILSSLIFLLMIGCILLMPIDSEYFRSETIAMTLIMIIFGGWMIYVIYKYTFYCPSCGYSNMVGIRIKFCPKCGAKID